MIKTKFLLFALFFALIQVAWSQSVSVSGTVSDGNGITLPGVNVIEKGTSNGSSTDIDGNYQINVAEDAVLIFSYVGFVTQEVPIAGRSVINITIREDFQDLEEVVVIGYGSQLRENVTGAVSSVDAEDLSNIPQTSIDQLLQGRAAGVTVTNNSGQPGSAVSVKIRGLTSINSNEPLYVIDGVPISGDASNFSTSGVNAIGGSRNNTDSETSVSPLSFLNPNDIQTIDILKDASATAIYGSRGANGVVIITTKKGRQGEGKIGLSTSLSIQEPTKFIDMMTLPQYARLQNVLNEIVGIPENTIYANSHLLPQGTDWQEAIFDRAIMSNHQLSFSGANENTNYYLSAGILDQEGTIVGSEFERISIQSNITSDVKDWLKVGVNLMASRRKEKVAFNGGFDGTVNIALLQSPEIPVYNPDGTYAGPVDDDALGQDNPVARVLTQTNRLTRNKIFGNMFTEIKLSKSLNLRTEFGGDFSFNKNVYFEPTFQRGRFTNDTNLLRVMDQKSEFYIFKNFLNFNKNLGNHSLNVMAGHEVQESNWRGVTSEGRFFPNNDIQTLNLSNPEFDRNTEYRGSTSLQSLFGRAIYSYDSRYNITATYRADQSSKFSPNGSNQWGYFPSLSFSWRLSNEAFMENFDAMSDIKIYGGWGVTGNQDLPNYTYGSTFSSVAYNTGTALAINNFSNEDIKWEGMEQINLGLDFTLFDSRLRTSIQVYDKTSSDFLFQLDLPGYITGGNAQGAIGPPWVNLGEINTKGLDLTIEFNSNSEKDFKWNSTLNIGTYRNEVKEFGLGLSSITPNYRVTGNDTRLITITRPGDPVGLFYGYKVKGIFNDESTIQDQPQQFGNNFSDAFGDTWLGDIQYEDTNGDGEVNDDDLTEIGDPNPDFTYGFNNTFTYKNVDLSIFLQGSYGNDIMNLTWLRTSSLKSRYNNQTLESANYWTPENTNTDIPRPVPGDNPNDFISDRIVEDGSYLRIQNVKLAYSLPQQLLETIKVKKVQLYGSVQNLYTFTDYKGYDPEVGSYNQNSLFMGIDNGRYPTPRTYTFGLNIEF